MQGLAIGFGRADHFRPVAGPFYFQDHADRLFGRFSGVDHQVLPVAGINIMRFPVPGCFQKIGDDVFQVFFRLAGNVGDAAAQQDKLLFEAFDLFARQVLRTKGG